MKRGSHGSRCVRPPLAVTAGPSQVRASEARDNPRLVNSNLTIFDRLNRWGRIGVHLRAYAVAVGKWEQNVRVARSYIVALMLLCARGLRQHTRRAPVGLPPGARFDHPLISRLYRPGQLRSRRRGAA
jgi:hypothetical protein